MKNIISSAIYTPVIATLLVLGLTKPAQAQLPDPSQGPIEMSDDAPAPTARPARKSSGGAPVVGRKAAEKYMGPKVAPGNSDSGESRAVGSQLSADDHYLALHVGGFVSDKAYNWGSRDRQSDVGDVTVGVTYRIGEWRNSMDLAMRVDFETFGLDTGTAKKLSFLPMITFPDASSRFPLYFGVGAGVGVFTNNVGSESAVSIDYQLLLGARFFEVIGNAGFFIEAGIKNHFLILSDGQFNGTFVAAGPVFTF